MLIDVPNIVNIVSTAFFFSFLPGGRRRASGSTRGARPKPELNRLGPMFGRGTCNSPVLCWCFVDMCVLFKCVRCIFLLEWVSCIVYMCVVCMPLVWTYERHIQHFNSRVVFNVVFVLLSVAVRDRCALR